MKYFGLKNKEVAGRVELWQKLNPFEASMHNYRTGEEVEYKSMKHCIAFDNRAQRTKAMQLLKDKMKPGREYMLVVSLEDTGPDINFLMLSPYIFQAKAATQFVNHNPIKLPFV